MYGHASDQKEDVLLVRKDGTSDFYAVRVKAGGVPQHFTIVGDRPVTSASN